MFSFFNPFKYWMIGIALAGIIGTFTYLNVRVNYLKKQNETLNNANASMKAINENWQLNYTNLQKVYQEQGKNVDLLIKDSETRKTAAELAIKKAQLIVVHSQAQYNAAKALSVQSKGKSCDEFDKSINKIIDEGK